MADKKIGDGAGFELSANAEMPDTEPGHSDGPDVFDPNAARRLAEGRGPGLQDSERFQPAHWVQPEEVAAADLVKAQREGNAPANAKDIRPEAK